MFVYLIFGTGFYVRSLTRVKAKDRTSEPEIKVGYDEEDGKT